MPMARMTKIHCKISALKAPWKRLEIEWSRNQSASLTWSSILWIYTGRAIGFSSEMFRVILSGAIALIDSLIREMGWNYFFLEAIGDDRKERETSTAFDPRILFPSRSKHIPDF